MKKYRILSFLSLVMGFLAIFVACRKEPILPDKVDFKSEIESITAMTITFNVTYNYSRNIDVIRVMVFLDPDLTQLVETTMVHASSNNGDVLCVNGLEGNTTYYYQFLLSNPKYELKLGKDTFTTMEYSIPEVTTDRIVNITGSSAQCVGSIKEEECFPIVERGVCWSKSQKPTTSDSHTIDGSGVGSFTSEVKGLVKSTTYYVRAYAMTAEEVYYGEQLTFTTTDGLPIVTTDNISSIAPNSAVCGGDITSDGGYDIRAKGICWSLTQNPTINNNHTTEGDGIGHFTSNLTDLTAGTTYYVRAYATNSEGTSYGVERTFTTTSLAPTVVTSEVLNISATSATCGGNVTSTGGASVTARGVCWGKYSGPTINSNHTTNGSGAGAFTSSITDLTPGTLYYVRAYATNSVGTTYGEQKSFTTAATLPTVTTNSVTSFTATTAIGGGNVTSTGGASTSKGICWSTSQYPTLSDCYASYANNGTGSFSCSMTGLMPGTTYYVRAYATNSIGTSYGEQTSFTTSASTATCLTYTVNGVSFTMVFVQGGTFLMGAQSTNSSQANYDYDAGSKEKPVHSVTLSSYYIGQTEVTQALWQAVMGTNPSHYTGSNQNPVESTSYNNCLTFISTLNSLLASQLNGKTFRLPTEAEWEYAARGGQNSLGYKWSGSNSFSSVAWCVENSGNNPHQVASKTANELGLFDMSGNVDEWCQDWYGSYSSGSQTNPTGPNSGSCRVVRGGCWYYSSWSCRVSPRGYNYTPSSSFSYLGLRLVLVP